MAAPEPKVQQGCIWSVLDFVFELPNYEEEPKTKPPKYKYRYENLAHALRGEHDWAIVIDTMWPPKGHDRCGRQPPKGRKLWAPATRWQMLVFIVLMNLFLNLLLGPNKVKHRTYFP